MEIISLIDVSKKYKDGTKYKIIFNNLFFNLLYPSLTALIGESGSGKSTLINILFGLEKIDKGKLKRKSNFYSYAPQASVLLDFLTVEENFIFFAGNINNLKKFQLSNKLNAYPNTLSVGERQRISIALTLSYENSVFFADEPTSALDSKNAEIVFELLKEESKKKSILLSSHNIELVNKFSNNIYTIANKTIKQVKNEGKPKKRKIKEKKRKISLKEILLYIKNSIFKKAKTNILITICIFLSFLVFIAVNDAKLSLKTALYDARSSNLTLNKSYLQVCENEDDSLLVSVNCRNPTNEEIEDATIEKKYNVDYMLNDIFHKNNIQTYKNNDAILKYGRFPKRFDEIITNERYSLGEVLTLESDYVFEYETKKDYLNEEVEFKVVGVVSNNIFKDNDFIYIDYDCALNYLSSLKLENISIYLDIEADVFKYFISSNLNNYKYVSFSSKYKDNAQSIAFLSSSQEYYQNLQTLFAELKKILDIIVVLVSFSALLFFFLTIRASIKQKLKNIGAMIFNGVDIHKINLLILFEFVLLTSCAFILGEVICIVIYNLINNKIGYDILEANFLSVFYSFLMCIGMSVVMFIINKVLINKKTLLKSLRSLQ